MTASAQTRFRLRTTEDFYATATIKDGAGSPLDLTGLELRMQVRRSFESSIVFEATIDNARIVVLDAEDGSIALSFSHADLRNIPHATYVQDLVSEDVTGYRSVLWTGVFIAEGGVTRWVS